MRSSFDSNTHDTQVVEQIVPILDECCKLFSSAFAVACMPPSLCRLTCRQSYSMSCPSDSKPVPLAATCCVSTHVLARIAAVSAANALEYLAAPNPSSSSKCSLAVEKVKQDLHTPKVFKQSKEIQRATFSRLHGLLGPRLQPDGSNQSYLHKFRILATPGLIRLKSSNPKKISSLRPIWMKAEITQETKAGT